MRVPPDNSTSHRQRSFRLLVGAVAMSLFAVACGGSDDDLATAAAAVDPIETNDGGVRVKPPDLLEGVDSFTHGARRSKSTVAHQRTPYA